MKLVSGNWATESDKAVAAKIVERLSSRLKDTGDSYEEACRPFAAGEFEGKWSWFDSQLFDRRFLVTDVFEDLRIRQEFDAMAVAWKKIGGTIGHEIYTPPLIEVSRSASAPDDIFEHEAIHVAQLLVDHQFPGKLRVPLSGPLPFMTERILKEFEAHLVQTVYFERAYESRLVLDFSCIESAQLAALRAGFSNYLRKCVSDLVAQKHIHEPSRVLASSATALSSDLSHFAENLSATFEKTVLDTADAIPSLDQLAFHLTVQLGKHVGLMPENDPIRNLLLEAFLPVLSKWSNYESHNPFEILHRFRPPNPPPKLNAKVMG